METTLKLPVARTTAQIATCALVVLSACATGPTFGDYIKQKEDEQLDAMKRNCLIKPNGEVGECGLIQDEKSEAWRTWVTQFVKNNCPDPTPPQTEAQATALCDEKASKAVLARLELRYYLADFNKAQLHCDADGGCTKQEFERKLLVLHDAAIMQQWIDSVMKQRRATEGIYCIPDGMGGVMCN